MTNTKGKRRGTRCMFFRPFRKHRVVPLTTYMQIYKKCDIVDIKGMGSIQNECPTNVTVAKLEESTMLPSMLLAL
ncbi:60s ribosomal protein l21-like, partial [Lynx pardinus]